MAENRKNFSIRRMIFNDKYLIITSLILAVLVWIVTSLNIGTDENKTIKVSVPISLGDEVSEQLGMQYYTLQDAIDLSVTITGAKYVIGQVTEDDLNIKFDTSNVTRAGEQSIPILVTKAASTLDFTVTNTYPSSVDAYFDVNEEKTFDLYLEYDESAVEEGYTFGTPVLGDDKIVVSGPQTYVDKIDKAVVAVEFPEDTKLTEPFSTRCDISFKGTGVEANYLKCTPKNDPKTKISNVAVTLPVLKETRLPVSVSIDDKPSGIKDSDISISYSVDEIDAGVLASASIKRADIGNISFADLESGTNEFSIDVTNLEGITILDEDLKTIDVTVVLSGDYAKKTVTLDPSDISIAGVQKGSSAELSNLSSRTVVVYLPSDDKDDKITLDPKCDLGDNAESGTYPLTFTVKGNSSAWVYGTYTVDVAIK